MTEREKIAARIRALRAKTVDNGCTEGEAIAAAEKVAEILAQYNMTADEAELRASPFEHHTEEHTDPVGERLWKVADGIAHLTGARYWVSRPGVHPIEIHFFGFAHEVDVAKYLMEICARAMRQEQTRLLCDCSLLVATAQRRRVLPFLDGMADRLRTRIRALKPPTPVGKGLVLVRTALIDAAMKEGGHEIQDQRARGSRDCESTYIDGVRAANRVPLNKGLNSDGRVQGLLR